MAGYFLVRAPLFRLSKGCPVFRRCRYFGLELPARCSTGSPPPCNDIHPYLSYWALPLRPTPAASIRRDARKAISPDAINLQRCTWPERPRYRMRSYRMAKISRVSHSRMSHLGWKWVRNSSRSYPIRDCPPPVAPLVS